MRLASKNRIAFILSVAKIVTGSLLFLTLCSMIIYLLWSEGRILPGVSVGGIELGGLKVSQAIQVFSREMEALAGKKVVLTYKKRPYTLDLNSIGIRLDVSQSIEKAYQIGRAGSFWRQMAARWRIYRRGYNLRPVFNNNRVSLNSFFHLLEAGIAVEPVRSIVTITKDGKVNYSPSRTGIIIDHQDLQHELENAAFQKKYLEIEIPTKKVVPPLTESDIKRWGLDQVLGIYTSKYETSLKDRVNNLLIASNAINNVIVYPGQNFSFNTWVGPRVTEAGYREAPVVYLGRLVPGVGGGVCQVSSTLYNAVLMSNLKIVQRKNHSLPSDYVPLARDATVVYDGVDFIFGNTNSDPILLVSDVEPPYLTVAILGKKTDWTNIKLETKIIETYPFQTKFTNDSSLAKGSKYKVKNGQKGVKAELWRTIEFLDGTVKKELVNTSIYPAQPEEYKIGVKPD